jgi:hypothetical protein
LPARLILEIDISEGLPPPPRDHDLFDFQVCRGTVRDTQTLQAITAVNSVEVEFEQYRRLHVDSLSDEPVAPALGYNGGRARLRGQLQSVISHVVDVRSKLEIVRDDLRERAQSLGHHSR